MFTLLLAGFCFTYSVLLGVLFLLEAQVHGPPWLALAVPFAAFSAWLMVGRARDVVDG